MPPHVTCITLNYTEWEIPQKCIASLKKSTYKIFNIVFTNNHSNHNQSNRLNKLNDPEDLTDKLINDKNKQNPNINNTNGRLRNKSHEYRMMKQLQNYYEYYKT